MSPGSSICRRGDHRLIGGMIAGRICLSNRFGHFCADKSAGAGGRQTAHATMPDSASVRTVRPRGRSAHAPCAITVGRKLAALASPLTQSPNRSYRGKRRHLQGKASGRRRPLRDEADGSYLRKIAAQAQSLGRIRARRSGRRVHHQLARNRSGPGSGRQLGPTRGYMAPDQGEPRVQGHPCHAEGDPVRLLDLSCSSSLRIVRPRIRTRHAAPSPAASSNRYARCMRSDPRPRYLRGGRSKRQGSRWKRSGCGRG